MCATTVTRLESVNSNIHPSVCVFVCACVCAHLCMLLHACILCSQLCYSGYFVSDCIVDHMSLKPYAVCQCKLVSWHSVNMTNSLVYNIARERERYLVGCKTTTLTVRHKLCISQSHALEKNHASVWTMCLCPCLRGC